MKSVLIVAFGGAFGSVCRYLVSAWALRQFGPGFPWGTFAVNVLGCFAAGIAAELVLRRFGGSTDLRLLLITGFMGGFTTFSAFSLDAVGLAERGSVAIAAVYVLASVAVSLFAVLGGLALARSIF